MYKRSIKTGRIRRYRKRKVYTLSGGQQQRVALARVIIKDAPIILCDEPTGSLDKDNAQDIITILKEMKQQDKTVIIVTHDQSIAQQCDRVIKL